MSIVIGQEVESVTHELVYFLYLSKVTIESCFQLLAQTKSKKHKFGNKKKNPIKPTQYRMLQKHYGFKNHVGGGLA